MGKVINLDINLSRKSNGVGRHDQIIHFDNGEKRYVQGVKWIWENQMVHIVDYLGVEYIINPKRVLYTERFSPGGEGYGGLEKSKEQSRKTSHRRPNTPAAKRTR